MKPRAHPERDIQLACEQVLALDGWRIIRMEQNYSERKRKCVGEPGMPDTQALRYWAGRVNRKPETWDPRVNAAHLASGNEHFWIEWKAPGGRLSTVQQMWHTLERKRGALTVIAGVDFPASFDGFKAWYRASGLERKR